MFDPLVGLDDYDRRHLTSHLIDAGRADDLHRLLAVESIDAAGVTANAWYRAKLDSDDAAGFDDDVAAAWRLADAAFTTAAPPKRASALALTCRYALITASLNSLTDILPPSILAALLQRGMRTPRSVLSTVQTIPDPSRRASSLGRLASALANCGLEEEVIGAAVEIDDAVARTEGLVGIAASVVSLAGFRGVLSAIRGLAADSNKAQVLRVLAARSDAPEAVQAEILDEAICWKDEDAAALVLTRLGEHLGAELAQRAAMYARQMRSPVAMARLAAVIGPRLQNGGQKVIEAALNDARTTRGALKRVQALAALGHHPEALAEVKHIPSARAQVEGLAALAAALSADDRKVALEGVFTQGPAKWKASALALLAPHVPTGEWEWLFQKVVGIEVREARARALVAIAPHAPQDLLPQFVRATIELPLKLDPAAILRVVAARLEEPELDAVLAKAKQARGHSYRGMLLSAVAPYLSEQQAESALGFVRRIGSPTDRALAIDALAQRLSAPSLEKAVASLTINDDAEARAALAALALPSRRDRSVSDASADSFKEDYEPLFSHSGWPKTELSVTATRTATSDPDSHIAQESVLPSSTGQPVLYWLQAGETLLPDSKAIQEAIHGPDFTDHPQLRQDEAVVAALRELIDLLCETERFDDALSAAAVIPNPSMRAETLNALVGLLPNPPRSNAISMALASAKAVLECGELRLRQVGNSPSIELVGVSDLAVQHQLLSTSQCKELADSIMSTQLTLPDYPRVRDWLPASLCWALARLVSQLEESATMESWLLQTASAIKDEILRAGTLARLGQVVGPNQLDVWSSAANRIQQPAWRCGLLTVQTRRFAEQGRTNEALNSLEQACTTARYVTDRDVRGEVLAEIAAITREWAEPPQDVVWSGQSTADGGLLRQLATLGRRNLLSDMVHLAPALAAVDDDAVIQTHDAICDVRKWWP